MSSMPSLVYARENEDSSSNSTQTSPAKQALLDQISALMGQVKTLQAQVRALDEQEYQDHPRFKECTVSYTFVSREKIRLCFSRSYRCGKIVWWGFASSNLKHIIQKDFLLRFWRK